MEKLVIIGNGVSGVTVARHVRKNSNMEILIISSETDYHFSRTALMYIYMGHMKYEHTKPYEDEFWVKNRIDLKRAFVSEINSDENKLVLKSGEEIEYSKLVLATGSQSNKFGWPGQDLPGVQGLFTYQDLELMEENTKDANHAILVGGGLIGVEMAEMLLSRGIKVTFLVRETRFWGNILPEGESELVRKHAASHGVNFIFGAELKEIIAGSDGRVNHIITGSGEKIDCQFVGLSAGVHPNIDLVKDSKVEIGRGILVNDSLETNISNIYAVGDCAEIVVKDGRNRIEPLWYTGKMQAEALANTICGNKTEYVRGTWFNSAKFFDIEYQTYGFVGSTNEEALSSFYWEHESNKICIHIVYNTETNVVTGMNVFGIRMRHQVWQKWLEKDKSLSFCISHLKSANFDPEFFDQYEPEILNQYNQEFPKNNISLSPIKWLTKRFA